MAYKDWKRHTGLGMNQDITEWHNEKTGQMITSRKGWQEVTIWNSSGGIIKERQFKTESAKLKYAKSYMRSH